MRHASFFNEIVDWGHLIERLMNSFCKIEDNILSKVLMKERLIMDDVQMVVNELLLDGSVIALYNAIDLGAPRVDKQMGDIGLPESCFEVSEIF